MLCFRNIFSVGKIVTDAQLTMYLVLLPSTLLTLRTSLFNHTYYFPLAVKDAQMTLPILHPSLLLLRMHNLHFLFLIPAYPPLHCFGCTN